MSIFHEIFIDNAADFLNTIVRRVISRHRHENRTSIANDNAARDNEQTGETMTSEIALRIITVTHWENSS
jgi:hypothetical protein